MTALVSDKGTASVLKKIGYVEGPETFGDAELSESELENCPSAVDLTDCVTASSCTAGCDAVKAARIRHETNAYHKIARRHHLGITVLPCTLRNRAITSIVKARRAIWDRGYTAKDAWKEVEDVMGKLWCDSDMRRLLTKMAFVKL